MNRALDPPGGGDSLGSSVHWQRFQMAFEYPVFFTRDVLAPHNPCLLDAVCRGSGVSPRPVAFLVDDGVDAAWPGLREAATAYCAAHGGHLRLLAPPRVVPGGERAKDDPEAVQELARWLRDLGADRHTVVVVVGGGALLDFAGYVVSTVHRGLRLVRVPTTVLAQNDSGVGVKTSVNAFGVKNFLGTFSPPFAVVNDFQFLATLQARDRRAGMAEAVKVALIRDAEFFAWLEARRRDLAEFADAPLERLVRRCAELHMAQIAGGGDPFEQGSARPLDYGHWAAHRLESTSRYALRHGEAVALGMALDTRYAVEAGLLDEGGAERVLALLQDLGLPLWHPHLDPGGDDGEWPLLAGIEEFREHLGGDLSVTLLRDVGRPVEVHSLDPAGLRRAARWLKARYGP